MLLGLWRSADARVPCFRWRKHAFSAAGDGTLLRAKAWHPRHARSAVGRIAHRANSASCGVAGARVPCFRWRKHALSAAGDGTFLRAKAWHPRHARSAVGRIAHRAKSASCGVAGARAPCFRWRKHAFSAAGDGTLLRAKAWHPRHARSAVGRIAHRANSASCGVAGAAACYFGPPAFLSRSVASLRRRLSLLTSRTFCMAVRIVSLPRAPRFLAILTAATAASL